MLKYIHNLHKIKGPTVSSSCLYTCPFFSLQSPAYGSETTYTGLRLSFSFAGLLSHGYTPLSLLYSEIVFGNGARCTLRLFLKLKLKQGFGLDSIATSMRLRCQWRRLHIRMEYYDYGVHISNCRARLRCRRRYGCQLKLYLQT